MRNSLEGVPTYEASGELQECFVDPDEALVPDSKTMEAMGPGVSMFDHPAIFSQATAMPGATLRVKFWSAVAERASVNDQHIRPQPGNHLILKPSSRVLALYCIAVLSILRRRFTRLRAND